MAELTRTTSRPQPVTQSLELNTGHTIPQIQLGVYLTEGQECHRAVRTALEVGYRGIDSAEWYCNEHQIGATLTEFLASSPLSRTDIFFTSKVQRNISYDDTRASIRQCIRLSQMGYVDLYMLHTPKGGREKRLECWRALEDAVESGEVRTIGVSNFGVEELRELLESKPRIGPAVNQLELHPFNTQSEVVQFCRDNNILVSAYSPFARGRRFDNPTIVELSEKYGCSGAQLLLRWSLQKGFVVLPKSVQPNRILSNVDVGWFEIGAEDMERLDGLDEGLTTASHQE
ncbi:putative aldo-keto reductase [Ascobolus immersus RN42]|uniref:Putative aldo-keto reductase n=1 Tax=Ascobolus immersus RN42 TaxID=1160509 RepID=A0A3N4HP28_ASCIM|nr:putative aldo-keto reductase [Ascobolus immersus RN42]